MEVSLQDLYLAYRQAKIALFFERRGVGKIDLAEFEAELPDRLRRLKRELDRGNWFDDIDPGEVWIVPKRMRDSNDDDDPVVDIGASRHGQRRRRLDVQVRLGPRPEFAIIEVLYLWRFGPFLDSILGNSSVGYRLDLRDGELSRSRRWLFEYWPRQYQKYRTEPLHEAIECLRDRDSSVCILSADLASFYNTIDPSFLLSDGFVAAGRRNLPENVTFPDDEYQTATRSLLNAYARFREEAGARLGFSFDTGVPIAALTSRLVANVALETLDSYVDARDDVICYRRYVDDMVIVAETEEPLEFEEGLEKFFPLHHIPEDESTYLLKTEDLHREGSEFQLQRRKVKIHNLNGIPGQDFVQAVKSDFEQVVSANRAFLDTPTLLEDGASHLIRVSENEGSPLRVLRNADRSKLERFSLSTSLATLERVSTMVEEADARQLIRDTLEKIGRIVKAEGNWAENLRTLLRLLKLAISTRDWESCSELLEPMERRWGTIEVLRSNIEALYFRNRKIDPSRTRPWVWLRNYLHFRRLEAICAAIPVDVRPTHLTTWLPDGLTVETRSLGAIALTNRAEKLARADLRAKDREADPASVASDDPDWMMSVLTENEELAHRLAKIGMFTKRCKQLDDSPWLMSPARLYLCTRPPSYFDIARRWLYRVEFDDFSVELFENLLAIVNAVRGTEYWNPVGEFADKHTVKIPKLGYGTVNGSEQLLRREPRIILGNLDVKPDYYKAVVDKHQSPIESLPRLKALNRILGRSDRIARNSARPSILVLPELSLPRSWLRPVGNFVVKSGGYGLVTGLEYYHNSGRNEVWNQAYAVLPSGYSSVATWCWTKRNPAPSEQQRLEGRNLSFPTFRGNQTPRTVLRTPWGNFSVLICSELLESPRVSDLLGRVELVLCPAWNKDTASFDHLLQSAAFQLHSIIAISNIARFSDCRAWAPRQTRWKRSLCRLIERRENDVVHVRAPTESLWKYHHLSSYRKSNNSNQHGITDDSNDDEPDWRPLPPGWQ